MTAPDTNIEKQQKRHKGPLIGMAFVFVVVSFVALASFTGVFAPEEGSEGEAAATFTGSD